MVAAPDNLLGIGIYTPAEAALYARAPERMVRRWFYGTTHRPAVLQPQLEDTEEKLLTFLDFVQTMAIRAIRLTYKVPLQRIREAIRLTETEYQLKYPLARRHTTYLFEHEVVIRLGAEEYVQVSGKHKRNRLIAKVVEPYMRNLDYGPEGLANAYLAFTWNNLAVTMNPLIRFGEPLLPSCGYTAQALWDAYKAEGSVESAASAYGVKQEEVELACAFFDYLNPALFLPRKRCDKQA
jgi:hypothetical protein